MPPPPGAANLHWALTQDLFKILMATAAYLDDDAALLRGVSVSRRANAAFGAAGWTQDRHPTDALLRAVLPAHEAAGTDAALPGGTLALQYFIYETGGDNLLRLLVAGDTARRSYRYVHPPDVGRLLSAGRHWQDPHALAELRGVEGISDFNLLMNVSVAMEDVPAEGYGAWLEDLLLGEEFEALVSDAQRLVVLPFNYLHNIPFQHVPAIRRHIEDGQLRELVVSPSLELTRRLSARDPVRRDAASCLFVGINSPEVDADAEYEVVRSAFERTEALIDRRATPAAIAAAAARHDVLHVACHGDFDAGRNTTYLLLSDERLYPADLALIADLHCDTVLLNACVTGVVAREGRNGDQSLGMATALLYGGARQVIATLWQVEADPAAAFASRFWEHWHGAPTTNAGGIVLDTQQELRRRYPTDVFAWGAHAVFGDWR
jgi:CHAT domain